MEKVKHQERLAALKAEIASVKTRQQVYGYVGAGLAVVFSLMLLMFATGDPLGILDFVGLGLHEKRGAYGDCSLAANKNAPWCKPEGSATEKTWDQMRRKSKGSQFSLD